MILSSADVDTVLHQILLIVRNYFGIANCAVLMVDAMAGELYVRAQNGYDESVVRQHRFKIGVQGVTGWVAQSKTPLYVPDISKEPRYLVGDPRVRSELALPLVVRDEVVGVLDLESDKLDYFTDDMIGLLALFAGQAAVALENARLYSTERRRMRQLELINLIARSATAANDIEQFLATMADLIYDTFEGTEVCILLRDPAGTLMPRAHAGSQAPALERFQASERSGILAQAFSARMNILQNDVPGQPDWPACLENSGSELCVPLVSFGDTLGAVVIAHPQRNFFSVDDRSIAQAAADVCATAIKNVHLADELRRVTSTDSLTGVYNQRYFHSVVAQEISRARRYNKRFALVMLDLRGFRAINAALGFDGGDEILCEVAQMLRHQLRSIDILCRYAGDRFALVLPETDRERMNAVLGKVQEGLSRIRYKVEGESRSMAASWAQVHYPHDGSGELELVRLLLSRVALAKKDASAAGA
jgi:diguanylate cyclase (GGDEF)-like protein